MNDGIGADQTPKVLAPGVAGRRIGVALSGGGVRAAVFHLGVIKRLAAENLLEEVSVASTVSAGSLVMAAIVPEPLRGAVQFVQRVQQGRGRRHLVRARRDPPAGLLRRHLDQLDIGPEGQSRRDHNDLYAFLTTEPNAEVGAIHPKAMPVILTTPQDVEAWMTAPPEEALKLQRPLPDGSLQIVARGVKEDLVGSAT
jgi:hypothetical protein